ncbi:MAG: imidazole glycerol phosphate synthase subunit HisH [Bacteroidia bacterium]|jgi:glutamine amidotransferase|nr:imidazole glycerol phosphate synthase subunit HisH [Bacteroidia bacterium]
MNKLKIGIVDYGVGNTLSVANALQFLQYKVIISNKQIQLNTCDVLILPGVGAFQTAMENLVKVGLEEVLLNEVFERKKPILGICVGMQLMATHSLENGKHKGLNWIPGTVIPIESKPAFPVPHVGWNTIDIKQAHEAFKRLNNDSHFYFDHSYYYQPINPEHIIATVEYGSSITAAIQKNHIMGVQFHPEKSQVNGLKLFKDFIQQLKQYA